MTEHAGTSAKRQKIAKAMDRAAEKVRKEGPSDGRFRPLFRGVRRSKVKE